MANPRFEVAIVGTGAVADVHAEDLARLGERARLVAAVDVAAAWQEGPKGRPSGVAVADGDAGMANDDAAAGAVERLAEAALAAVPAGAAVACDVTRVQSTRVTSHATVPREAGRSGSWSSRGAPPGTTAHQPSEDEIAETSAACASSPSRLHIISPPRPPART